MRRRPAQERRRMSGALRHSCGERTHLSVGVKVFGDDTAKHSLSFVSHAIRLWIYRVHHLSFRNPSGILRKKSHIDATKVKVER